MKVFFIFLLLAIDSHANGIDSLSPYFFPHTYSDEVIYLQKYEPYIYSDVAQYALEEGLTGQKLDILYENVAVFNYSLYRIINNNIDDLVERKQYSFIQALHMRDLVENVKGDIRYIIKSTFDYKASFIAKDKLEFYLYDQSLGIRYKSVESIEVLLEAINETRLYLKKNLSHTPESTNNFFDKSLPKAKEPMKAGTKFFIGTLLYAIAQSMIIVLVN